MKTKGVILALSALSIMVCAAYVFRITHLQARSSSRNINIGPANQRRRMERMQLQVEANAAWDTHDLGKVERIFRRMVQTDKSDTFALYRLAQVLEEQGRLREAFTIHKWIIHNPANATSSFATDPIMLLHYAQLCERFGERDEAMRAYWRIVQVNAELEQQKQELRRSLHETGLEDPPISVLTQDKDEIIARAFVIAAEHHIMHGDKKAGTQCFRQAIEYKPDLAVAHYYLSLELLKTRHIAESKMEFALADKLGDDAFRSIIDRRDKEQNERMAAARKSERDVGFSYDGPGRPLKITTRLLHPGLNK